MIYTGNRHDVAIAVEIVDLFFEYRYVESWLMKDYAEIGSKSYAEGIIRAIDFTSNVDCPVVCKYLWRPKYFYTNAYYHKRKIVLNTRKMKSFSKLCATLAHENVHFADSFTYLDFGHGDNSSQGKDYTVPYWVGNKTHEVVEELLEKHGTPLQIMRFLIEEHS